MIKIKTTMKAQQKLFTLFILLYSAFSFAQTDSLDFKGGFLLLPEKKYTLEDINTIIVKIYSDNALLDSVKKETVLQRVATTRRISKKDSIFPVSVKYLRSDENPFLQNAEVKGYCKLLKMPIFTEVFISSMKLSKKESDDFMIKMSNFFNEVELPSKKIKTGDTLSIVRTTDASTGGHLKIDINFVLKEIKEGKAYFNITSTEKLENSTGISGGGTGSGTAVYDIVNHIFLSINTDRDRIFVNKNSQDMVKARDNRIQTIVVEDNP